MGTVFVHVNLILCVHILSVLNLNHCTNLKIEHIHNHFDGLGIMLLNYVSCALRISIFN